jgi:hypothetical protein
MAKESRITEQTKQNYASLFLMRHMLDEDAEYLVALQNDEKILDQLFSWLLSQSYVEVTERDTYAVTASGRSIVQNAEKRYQSFLEKCDIFCAVDLETGEFAFAHYHDFEDEEEWHTFLSQERWDDLRVAMAEYLDFDVVEMIYMTMVRDGHFGFDDEGWNYELLLGEIWDEISDAIDAGIRLKSLGYVDGSDIISAENVAADIIAQGQDLLAQLASDG